MIAAVPAAAHGPAPSARATPLVFGRPALGPLLALPQQARVAGKVPAVPLASTTCPRRGVDPRLLRRGLLALLAAAASSATRTSAFPGARGTADVFAHVERARVVAAPRSRRTGDPQGARKTPNVHHFHPSRRLPSPWRRRATRSLPPRRLPPRRPRARAASREPLRLRGQQDPFGRADVADPPEEPRDVVCRVQQAGPLSQSTPRAPPQRGIDHGKRLRASHRSTAPRTAASAARHDPAPTSRRRASARSAVSSSRRDARALPIRGQRRRARVTPRRGAARVEPFPRAGGHGAP